MSPPRTAILLGATGLVGSALLQQLLDSPSYHHIQVITRRSLGLNHPQLEEKIVDFDQPAQWTEAVRGDILFSAFGTTLRKAGSKAAQHKVDFTYQLEVAKAAANHGVGTYILVSSAGADANSRVFYSRLKGQLDAVVHSLPFKSVYILRPSILDGQRKEFRLGERIGLSVARVLRYLPHFLGQYRPIHAETVAQAMVCAAAQAAPGYHVYELEEVFNLAKGSDR